MRYLAAFGRFWWDFIVGDEWRFAVIVVWRQPAGPWRPLVTGRAAG